MTTATAPVLAGTTLPIPKTHSVTRLYRGGTLEMASGLVIHDLVDTTVRHAWRLRWEYLNDSELTAMETAYEATKQNQVSYVDILADLYSVKRPEGGTMSVEFASKAGGELAYHVEFELVEGA